MLRHGLCLLTLLAAALPACSSDSESPSCSVEICNGKDDDCNGVADDANGAALTQTCDANGVTGSQKCEAGKWTACEAACKPTGEEICNGKDDDCDGTIDKGPDGKALQVDCSNTCGKGTAVCVDGDPENCNAPQPSAEVCDGQDNDCNGKIDETFDCAEGEKESCGSDVGACEYGERTCQKGTCKWGACTGGVEKTTEACDGVKDDDCDGTVDNGCTCADGATQDCCGGTKVTCAGGAWPACPTPPAETCNDKDDDCNGKVDDNLPVTPYMVEEDITKKDTCDLAKLATADGKLSSGTTFQAYLYKSDGTADSDWFTFTTVEASSGFCTPFSDQCVTTTFTLTEPSSTKDYEFCVWYDELGTVSCGGGKKVCSTDAGQAKNKITVKYTGTCALEDGIQYIMEVKPVTAGTASCKPYKVQMDWTTVEGACP